MTGYSLIPAFSDQLGYRPRPMDAEQTAVELEHLRGLVQQARAQLAQAGFPGVSLAEQLAAALARASEAEHWQRLYAQAVDPSRFDT